MAQSGIHRMDRVQDNEEMTETVVAVAAAVSRLTMSEQDCAVRTKEFLDPNTSVLAAFNKGCQTRYMPSLMGKFLAILRSLSNRRTVDFVLSNFRQLIPFDKTAGGNDVRYLRTVERVTEKHRTNLRPWLCVYNMIVVRNIYAKIMKQKNIPEGSIGWSIAVDETAIEQRLEVDLRVMDGLTHAYVYGA